MSSLKRLRIRSWGSRTLGTFNVMIAWQHKLCRRGKDLVDFFTGFQMVAKAVLTYTIEWQSLRIISCEILRLDGSRKIALWLSSRTDWHCVFSWWGGFIGVLKTWRASLIPHTVYLSSWKSANQALMATSRLATKSLKYHAKNYDMEMMGRNFLCTCVTLTEERLQVNVQFSSCVHSHVFAYAYVYLFVYLESAPRPCV